MSIKLIILLGTLSPLLVLAANDWSKPCVSGTCSFDTGDGVNTAYASIILNGPGCALSDITPAAGWQISGCSPSWSTGTQNVEVTCSGTTEQMQNCEHVLQDGAVDKIVRLPQNCGTGPFARVVSWQNGKRSNAHAVTLDFNFKNIKPNGRGRVSFSATATNVPNNSTLSATTIRTRGRRRLQALALTARFNESDTINAPPINLSKDFTLLDKSFSCPANGGVGVDASLKVDVSVGLDAQVAFGYVVAGNIVPPQLTQLSLSSTLTGDASAGFNVAASVKGSFDTGSVQIFKQGLPGLSVPGIISLGPQFVVNGQVNADLGVQANVKAGAKWTFPKIELVFPPSQGRSIAQATPAQTPLDLSINPTATVDGSLTGHIIPKVELGVDVLEGLASATVFLDVDVSSTLGLQVSAAASASNTSPDSASASGCVTLDGAIDVAAGAQGAIKPIFDKNVNFDIFNKKAQLFQKCFNVATPGATVAAKLTTSAAKATSKSSATATTSATGNATAADSTTTSTDSSGTTTTDSDEATTSTASADSATSTDNTTIDNTADSVSSDISDGTSTDSADTPASTDTESSTTAGEPDATASTDAVESTTPTEAASTDTSDTASSTDDADVSTETDSTATADSGLDPAVGAEVDDDSATTSDDTDLSGVDDTGVDNTDTGSDDGSDTVTDDSTVDASPDDSDIVGGSDDSTFDDSSFETGDSDPSFDTNDSGIDDSAADSSFSDGSFDDGGVDDPSFGSSADSSFDESDSGLDDSGFDDSAFEDSSFDDSSFNDSGFNDSGFNDSGFGDDFKRSILPRGIICPGPEDDGQLVNVASQ